MKPSSQRPGLARHICPWLRREGNGSWTFAHGFAGEEMTHGLLPMALPGSKWLMDFCPWLRREVNGSWTFTHGFAGK
ncbi:hypothetical protein [Prolixibacter bellariivorans]|uniref:hypothetical protein n=1 Tax=Prolixibacter bellariivorans TaxID=314319 RepID=UPI0012990CF9|nr:hypothetical protein [Prolixibacter bellariivorans]